MLQWRNNNYWGTKLWPKQNPGKKLTGILNLYFRLAVTIYFLQNHPAKNSNLNYTK
jgi:hypothetical protein